MKKLLILIGFAASFSVYGSNSTKCDCSVLKAELDPLKQVYYEDIKMLEYYYKNGMFLMYLEEKKKKVNK